MEQRRIADRRIGRDRRTTRTSAYTGPERRSIRFRRNGFDRRKEWPPICAYCGKVCGDDWKSIQAFSTVESTVESLISICPDCSKKRFPQFYSND